MAATIHLKPEQVWDFWEKHKERLAKEMVLIAEYDDVAIYLSAENTIPYIYACKGDDIVQKEGMVNKMDATDTAYTFYSKYLIKKDESDSADSVRDADFQAVEDRENELYAAFCDFLVVAMDCSDEEIYESPPDELNEALDDVLLLLSEKHGFFIYRPTILEDENGEEYLEEYPYLN